MQALSPDLKQLERILINAAQTQLPKSNDLKRIGQSKKADGSVVTEIDTRLQAAISAELSQTWPDIPLLGEEMTHEQQSEMLLHSEQGLWILDPLDGTTNFTTGFPLYGLSLAFVQGGKTRLAVIYDPNREECFSAEMGKGAYLNGQPLNGKIWQDEARPAMMLKDCVANVDYKRLTSVLAERLVNCPPYRSQRNMGTCVLEWCWLAANRIQLYLHGGQQLWDHAAGRLILEEAGGKCTTLKGLEMRSDNLVKQSAVAAASSELHDEWLAWISGQS